MAEDVKLQSIQVIRTRVAQLAASGAPLPGAGHGYVSDSQIDVTLKIVTNAGQDQTQEDGAGNVCASYQTDDKVKNITADINFCALDTYLINLLTASPLFASGGHPIGFQLPSVTAASQNGVCLEFWSRAWNSTQQAVPDFTSPNVAYWHWVIPLFKGILGDVKLDSSIQVVPVSGKGTENSHVTANGPYDDWPAAVAASGGVTACYGVFLDSSIPNAASSLITVTSAAS